jgi:hypothetical protein
VRGREYRQQPGNRHHLRQDHPGQGVELLRQALPQDGDTITTNSVVSQSSGTAAIIQFTGHGFSGNIDALSKFTDSAVSVAGLGHKNVTTITFMPK